LKKKKVIFSSRLDELARIRSEIERFIGDDLDKISRNRVILSLDEAVSNIIRHGYKGAESGSIELSMSRSPKFISFTLCDEAPPYNPLDAILPDLETHFDNGREGGLGVDLYRKLMKVSYTKTKKGGNRLTLKKELEHESNKRKKTS
jgi:serine/threonine-protein kinase RsbW